MSNGRGARQSGSGRGARRLARPQVDLVSAADLRRAFIPSRLPQSENYRTYYGRSLDLGRIENALLQADAGLMSGITDLEGESLGFDPHLSCVVSKRFGQLLGLDWDVSPAQGEHVDRALAERMADDCRRAFAAIPHFKTYLYLLGWNAYDGRASLETHWDTVAGVGIRWAPRALAWVHPRRLSFGPARDLRVVDTWRARGNFTEDGLPIDEFPGKFIRSMSSIFREYPEREGLAPRTLYWAFFKRFGWRYRMVLTELFGIPWRIIKAPDPDKLVGHDALDEAEDEAEQLGAETTARLGPGVELDVIFPGSNSGNLFQMSSEEVDAQMSKLVLWQTGTTDAEANRAESIVHKAEQDLLPQIDTAVVSQSVDDDLVAPFCALNYGREAALVNAPTFQMRSAPARDRMAELERTEKVISLGVPVAVSELNEMSGVRVPGGDEPYVVGSSQFGFRVVDPTKATAQPEGEEQPPPYDATDEAFVTVNEARASRGRGPKLLPNGLPDPDGYLTVYEYKAKLGAGGGEFGAPPQGGAAPEGSPHGVLGPEPGAMTGDLEDEQDAAEKEAAALVAAAFGHLVPQLLSYGDPDDPEYGDEQELLVLAGLLDDEDEAVEFAAREGGPLALAAARPGEQAEYLVERSTKEGARAFESLVAGFLKAVPDKGGMDRAWRAVSRAAGRLDVSRLARVVEQASLRAVMQGAWEAAWEAENDDAVEPPKFSARQLAAAGGAQAAAAAAEGATKGVAESVVGKLAEADFVRRPFREAIQDFAARRIMTKAAFKRLVAANKRRAFTIAGLGRRAMIETAHDELTRAIEAGSDVRKFRAALAKRFSAAGWTQLKPSRVNLVFRNAVMSASANGRHAQMTQPHVLKARPYWQVLGVDDKVTRKTHKAAHGKVLRASDPFWERAPLPWGHNCRDRKVSRSEEDLKRLGLKVSKGSEAWARALPDEGWNASRGGPVDALALMLEVVPAPEPPEQVVRVVVEAPEAPKPQIRQQPFPPAAPPAKPRAPSFAERNAAFLADLKDYRANGLTVTQAEVDRLAKEHGISPAPRLGRPWNEPEGGP